MKTNLISSAALIRLSCQLLTWMLVLCPIIKPWGHEHLHTHPSLSLGSLLFLDQVSPEDGALFSFSARTNIRAGSINEDEGLKFRKHFYDPKTKRNTHLGFSLTTAPEQAGVYWAEAVDLFRNGAGSADRALAFEQLGRVVHLLQDMSSPAHVHNDVHAENIASEHCSDGDDFENWGWSECPTHPFNHILEYITANDMTASLTPNLTLGLSRVFSNQAQHTTLAAGEPNLGYAYVRALAEQAYEFTTFQVKLVDTSSLTTNDRGEGKLALMFPGLVEFHGQWDIPGVGYSIGECNLIQQDQEWWMMSECSEVNPVWHTHVVQGMAYIENTGGGIGSEVFIPDNVVPKEFDKRWFIDRYGTKVNSPTRTMLRIYGDVLYPAAVAYGAGLLQAFLDDAVMPRPITASPIMTDGSRGRLTGRANPGGAAGTAWFEWSQNGGSIQRTLPQGIGSGLVWANVTAAIQGLAPETTYRCRLVSSNRFGLRYGAIQVFRTPAYLLTANGMNAWQITDDSKASGSLRYLTNLTTAQQTMALNNGWKLTFAARLVTDFSDARVMTVSYTVGGQRFLFWLDLNSAGDLIAEFDGGILRTLTSNRSGATDYHTHEIQYANGKATYRFDGTLLVTNWPGILTIPDFPAGQISWGATSTAGRGRMNIHRVEFVTGNSNVVAAYNAGTAGNPGEAPAPTSQGWTRLATATPLSEGPLSPDGETSLPQVETLAASGLSLQGARLNGRVDPRGSAALVWFEWGSDAGYGSVTPPQLLSVAPGWTDVAAQLGALTQDTTYHFRIVASNSFGVRFGTNRTFVTPSYLLTGTLPNAWQITDGSNAGGSTYNYRTNLATPDRVAATNTGWRYSVTARMTANFQGSDTMHFTYALGNVRFLVWWDLDDLGNLTAMLEGQSPRIVATNGAGATDFHTHELVYDRTNRTAAYWFDGNLVASWAGASSAATAGQIGWGAGSSAGMAQMNFHRAEFIIASLGTVAAYQAGTAGNPSVAPNPVMQGWTLSAGAGPTSAPISPESVPFQPIADAETLAASAVGPSTALLQATVNPRGQPTAIWFEWGTTAGYGSRTAVQSYGGSGALPFSQGITGLTVDTMYHYRVVASNAFAVSFGSGQTFRTRWFQDSGIQLAAVDVGSVAWGDYDNDEDLDLIVTGQSNSNQVSQLYRNQGGTNLVAIASGLPALNRSAVAWGDYDGDGYLDVLISGWNETGTVSRVYRNRRDGTFLDVQAGLPGLTWSAVAWADYDNDGDLDVFLSGHDTTTNGIARIYRNDRGTNFVDINAGLPGVSQGSVAWADFDSDGDQDLLLTGRATSQGPISRLYQNAGGGLFSELPADFPGVEASSVAWGDYDSDGDPDLLLSGWDGETYLTRLYRNEHTGAESTFVTTSVNLPNISSGSVAWGDFDNDGDLDLLMAGWSGTSTARVFRNDGAEVFVELGAELVGVNWSSTAWADYDKDGDLDFIVTGSTDSTRVCRLYRNETAIPNTPPSAPWGLAGSGVGNITTLRWELAGDATTPSSALSYNVILTTSTNALALASPLADWETGFRRVVQPGNVANNVTWTFTGLSRGTYYFSVQAIDSAFAGGPFAPWQTVQVASTPILILSQDFPQPGQFRIRFTGTQAGSYEVWRSTDLSSWAMLGTGLETAPELFEFTDPAAPTAGAFYRVQENSTPD